MEIKVLLLFTEAFTKICRFINKHFGRNNISEGHKHLHQVRVSKLLRQVVNEEVTALGSRNGAACKNCHIADDADEKKTSQHALSEKFK